MTADKFYFAYSSHGTQVPDVSGDEKDSYDEAFICYDTTPSFENVILDDELFNLFAEAPKSVTIEVFLDTCHSGTGLRKLNSNIRIKYLRNPKVVPCACPKVAKKELFVKEHPNVILWAACKDNEYASDTEFNGRPNGAFTYYMLNLANAYPKSWRRTVYNKMVPNLFEYNQTPQLESRCVFKYRKI